MSRSPETGPRHRLETRSRLNARNIAASIAILSSIASLESESGDPSLPVFSVSIPNETPQIIPDPAWAGDAVFLPGAIATNGERFFPNHPVTEEPMREKGGYCQVADLAVPRYFDRQEIERGAHTDFALSTEAYMEAKHQLKEAGSIAEMQRVMTAALSSIGVNASYGKIGSNIQRQPDGTMAEQFTNGAYAQGLSVHLEALTLLPRELVEKTKKIKFAGSDRVDSDDYLRVLGEYDPNFSPDITVAVFGAVKTTLVHEEVHAAHDTACERFADTQLKAEHKEASDYLKTDPLTRDLEIKLATAEALGRATPKEQQEYLGNGLMVGFPDQNSRKDHKELMAALGTEMIVNGSFVPGVRVSTEGQDSALLLREMVVERLQEALPHTDVPAWLTYLNMYSDTPPSVANPQMIAEYHVSPLDGGDAYWNKWQERTGTLTPAVAIRSGNEGDPNEYIYDYQEGDMHTIVIRTADIDSPLVKAAYDYLVNLPGAGDKIIQAGTIRQNSAIMVTSRPDSK